MATKAKPKKRKINVRLPSVPSELIRVALKDLRAVERNPKYVVDMDEWHAKHADGLCHVCLAGATLTNAVAPGRRNVSEAIDGETWQKMEALDNFRSGFVGEGLADLGLERPWRVRSWRGMHSYETNPAQFHHDMQRLADDLEAAGL